MKKLLIFIGLVIAGIVVLVMMQDEYGCPKNGRDECILKIASEPERDLSTCTEISSPETKDKCYSMFASKRNYSYEACSMISDTAKRDDCFGQFATKKRMDPAVCPLFTSQELGEKCYAFMAKSFSDAAQCSHIGTLAARNDCLDFLVGKNITQACSEYSTTPEQDLCFEKIAKSMNEAAYCSDIDDKSIHDSCFDYIARTTNQSSFCFEINDELARNKCKYDFSQSTAADLCDDISGLNEPYTRNNCYFNKALTEKNRQLCYSITEKGRLDICLRSLELYVDDESNGSTYPSGMNATSNDTAIVKDMNETEPGSLK
jgi:hypothetical protein